MIGWIFAAVWFAGFLANWRWFVLGHLVAQERDFPSSIIDNEDRILAVLFGTIRAIVWPISLPIVFIYRRFTDNGFLKTDNELAAEQNREIERLRRIADEAGLDLGDTRTYR